VVSMNSDFEELLRIFSDNEVKYLIVGGHAVMLYTEPRYTKDLDVWIEASEENAAKVFRALAEFGAPLSGLSADDFAREGFFYQLGRPPARVDILMSIDGIRFDEAWPNRNQSEFGSQRAWFISRADLPEQDLEPRTRQHHQDARFPASDRQGQEVFGGPMIARANKTMRSLVPCDISDLSSLQCALPEPLREALQEAEFAEVGGLVTFVSGSEPCDEARKDLTGLECLLNKWHIDAYIRGPAVSLEELTRVGICYALALQERVSHAPVYGQLRIIVSSSRAFDESLPNNCTVYLHQLRPDNTWLNEDLESYASSGVLTIDWLNPGSVSSRPALVEHRQD